MGIFETNNDYLDQNDLNTFFTTYNINITNGTFPAVNAVNGASYGNGVNDGESSEANLDFQVAYPIVTPQKLTLFQDLYGSAMDSFLNSLDEVRLPLLKAYPANKNSPTAITPHTMCQ